MDSTTQRNILLLMLFLGGFIIVFTFAVFRVFYRFLERERIAGERFREEHRARTARRDDDAP